MQGRMRDDVGRERVHRAADDRAEAVAGPAADRQPRGEPAERDAKHHKDVECDIGPPTFAGSQPRIPSSGIDGFHIRFTPAGAPICVVTNGLRPLASACGVQPRYQMACSGSQQRPAQPDVGPRQARNVTATAPSR